MTRLDRVLEPKSAEMPECICGRDMSLTNIEPNVKTDDAEIRQYGCQCGHRMRLSVWTH